MKHQNKNKKQRVPNQQKRVPQRKRSPLEKPLQIHFKIQEGENLKPFPKKKVQHHKR